MSERANVPMEQIQVAQVGAQIQTPPAQRSQLSGCITGLTLIFMGFMGALLDTTVDGSDTALVKTVFEAYLLLLAFSSAITLRVRVR